MTLLASFITDFWNDQLIEHNREGLFLVLVGFIGSFGFIRTSARIMRSPRLSWWPGSVVSDSGVHLHHLVFGIVAMVIAGTAAITLYDVSPWFEIFCAIFGIGVGLTIDEFALWVHLDDVYWSDEGRSSIDAAVLGVAAMGMVLLGWRPFDIDADTSADLIASIILVVIVVGCSAICFAKRRLLHGVIGIFVPVIGIYGACRIGKPNSIWAKRRYRERSPKKQAKAEQRFRPERRTQRFKQRLRDAIGGTPTGIYEAKLAERAATHEAAAEIRERADAVAEGERAAEERERDETPAG